MTQQQEKMPIRVLARRAGESTYTINFYVQQGLLPPPEKLNRTRALYSEEHVEWLEVIRKFRSLGYSLQLLKRALQQWGHSRQTLDRLKRSGGMQAIPESGLHAAEAQGLHAPPMSIEELTKATGLSVEQVGVLEQWGLLRPKEQGLYDASDQELAVMVERLLDQGILLEDMLLYQDFLPVAQRLIRVNHKIARRNMAALRRREVGMRELGQPLIRIMDYLLFRTAFEITPNFGEILFGEADFPRTIKATLDSLNRPEGDRHWDTYYGFTRSEGSTSPRRGARRPPWASWRRRVSLCLRALSSPRPPSRPSAVTAVFPLWEWRRTSSFTSRSPRKSRTCSRQVSSGWVPLHWRCALRPWQRTGPMPPLPANMRLCSV